MKVVDNKVNYLKWQYDNHEYYPYRQRERKQNVLDLQCKVWVNK